MLLVLLIAAVSRGMLAAIRPSLEARVRRRYPSDLVLASEYGANSFGQASRGKLQTRGNGALIITATELCFFQIIPATELVIPLSAIRRTSLVRSHLGKATPFKLLKLELEDAAGSDSVAFLVRAPAALRVTLDLTRAQATVPAAPVR